MACSVKAVLVTTLLLGLCLLFSSARELAEDTTQDQTKSVDKVAANEEKSEESVVKPDHYGGGYGHGGSGYGRYGHGGGYGHGSGYGDGGGYGHGGGHYPHASETTERKTLDTSDVDNPEYYAGGGYHCGGDYDRHHCGGDFDHPHGGGYYPPATERKTEETSDVDNPEYYGGSGYHHGGEDTITAEATTRWQGRPMNIGGPV